MNLGYVSINRHFYWLTSVIFIFIGMAIYLLFRNTNMLLFQWIPKLEYFKNVYIPMEPSIFRSILLFNLPDALWFLSGILFFRFLWFKEYKEQKIYVLCFYFTGFVFEISQLSEKIHGTFDYLDLFFMGIGAFIEGLLYKKYFLKRRIV